MPGLIPDEQYGLLPPPQDPAAGLRSGLFGGLHGMFVQPFQDIARGLGSGLTPQEGQDLFFGAAAGMLPMAKIAKGGILGAMAKATSPSADEFAAMAARGRIRPANTAQQDLHNVLSGKVPATDFDISGSHPFAANYESGSLIEQLKAKKLHVDDDQMGRVFVGTTPDAVDRLKAAQTPAQFGSAYGYPPDDIARFYLERRGGNVDVAYPEFIKDWINK